MTGTTPHDLVETALEASKADDCIVIVTRSSSANLRWANNTLTTNGLMSGAQVSVISIVATEGGAASAALSRSASTVEEVRDLVAAADEAARAAGPAEDAGSLVGGEPGSSWDAPPEPTSIGVFYEFAPALGEAFGQARAVKGLF